MTKNIIISSGGVSDTSLLNLSNLIDKTSKFGDIYLMDPLSKLKSFESSKVKVIQNESLSRIMNNLEFKFGIFAGGTSKYIAAAYSLPSLLIPRNDIEELLIEKFLEDNLSFNMDFLVDRPQEKLLIKHFSIISNNLNIMDSSRPIEEAISGEKLIKFNSSVIRQFLLDFFF